MPAGRPSSTPANHKPEVCAGSGAAPHRVCHGVPRSTLIARPTSSRCRRSAPGTRGSRSRDCWGCVVAGVRDRSSPQQFTSVNSARRACRQPRCGSRLPRRVGGERGPGSRSCRSRRPTIGFAALTAAGRDRHEALSNPCSDLRGMGSNKRYGSSLARAKANSRAEVAALRPRSLTAAELGDDRVVRAREVVPVRAWVLLGDAAVQVEGVALAWTSKAVQIQYPTDADSRSCWVWASACERLPS